MSIIGSKVSSRQYVVSRKSLNNLSMSYLKRSGSVCCLLFSAYCLLLTAYSYADELRDIKPPVDLPETPWLLIALITLGVLLLILGIWYLLRLKPKVVPKIEIKTPWDLAYERMDELKKRDPFGQGKAKEHFIELSAIAREYIENRFNIRAPEMTTQEFLDHVKNAASIEGKHKEILASFLRLCDMVKFAKYGPNAQEAIESFELIKKIVDETKEGIGVRV